MGVVLPTLSHWFYAAVLDGADRALRSGGFDVVLFNWGGPTGDRERDFHHVILGGRTDALLTVGMTFAASERRELAAAGHPAVSVGAAVQGFRHVGIDDVRTAREATPYLIGLGHRHIALLTGRDTDRVWRRVAVDRRKGYLEALREAGIGARDEWGISCEVAVESARAAVAQRLGTVGRWPTAIFAATDEMAIGAMIAITERGLRIPADISVVGIDDHDWSEAFGLTTFAQDPRGLGESAAALLIDQLSSTRSIKRSIQKIPALIERTSTAPPFRV